jgi:thymidylate synthase
MKTSEAINDAIKLLLNSKETYTEKWQGIKIDAKIMELDNLFIEMEMCKSIDELVSETKADLPWSENHFKERLNGASNPGEQYKYWPYYRDDLDDTRFRNKGMFSHTYQERFWPIKKNGIRYEMGDWLDIKNRLKNNPSTRQAFFSIWHPEDQSNNNVRLPCTIGYWFKINNIGELDLTYLIRSCDARRHFRNDIYMTQRLAMDMLEFLDNKDIRLGKLNMWIGSFHCFISDVYSLNKILKK